ncbi:MAG TPA: hypothetical protein DCZ63_12965 [Geobacter sp.]|nr:hypothetical protein [Geobacter sp.]
MTGPAWSEKCRAFRLGLPRMRPDWLISQEICAAMVGVTAATWAAWESGKRQPHRAMRESVARRMQQIEQQNGETK